MNISPKQLIIIGVVCILLMAVVATIFVANNNRASEQQATSSSVKTATLKEHMARYLAADPVDLSHIGNIKSIQGALRKYFDNKQVYPKKLSELAPAYLYIVSKYSSSQDYFYAYFPADKPTAYHLGAPLGGNNPADGPVLSQDADFNSKKAGYVNGFDGTDPVYDLVGGSVK